MAIWILFVEEKGFYLIEYLICFLNCLAHMQNLNS